MSIELESTYLAKADAANDRDLRAGYRALAKAAANPVIHQLDNLSEQQLQDVVERCLELLPADDDGESAPASATEYGRD